MNVHIVVFFIALSDGPYILIDNLEYPNFFLEKNLQQELLDIKKKYFNEAQCIWQLTDVVQKNETIQIRYTCTVPFISPIHGKFIKFSEKNKIDRIINS